MTSNAGWLRRPQGLRSRRWLFQLHQWTGLLLGVYIVVICVSGSVAVFRPDLSRALIPRVVEQVGEARLGEDDFRAVLATQFPEHDVLRISEARRAESLVYVTFVRGGVEMERLADPYTGRVVGDPYPPVIQAMEWTVRLHDDLLSGQTGRKINGVAGILVALLVLSGIAIWWPGTKRWPIGLIPRRGPSAPGVLWQLHAIIGIGCAALLFLWAVTGVYFAFPHPFEGLIDYFDADLNDFERPGEALLLTLIRWHFGRFGGLPVSITWGVLGLLPAVLFITGFTLWWRRISRRYRRGAPRLPEQRSEGALPRHEEEPAIASPLREQGAIGSPLGEQ